MIIKLLFHYIILSQFWVLNELHEFELTTLNDMRTKN